MTAKRFELEVLNNYEYVIAEFDKDNYYLDDENSAKSLECRLNELFEENEQLKHRLAISEKANFVTALEKENEQLKSKLESAEKVLENIGYELVYSETYGRWLIE